MNSFSDAEVHIDDEDHSKNIVSLEINKMRVTSNKMLM